MHTKYSRRVVSSLLGGAIGLSATLAAGQAHAEAPPAAREPSIFLGSDWTLFVDGQYRPRAIVHSGRTFVEGQYQELVTQRARLGFRLEQSNGLGFRMSLQDVRIWGEETNTLNDFSANGFDVHEAYGTIPITCGLSLKLGRQEIALDNHRLVGNVDWTQRGRSFDGGRLSYVSDLADVDLFYAKIREAGVYPDGNVTPGIRDDVDFAGAHATLKIVKELSVSPMYLMNLDHGIDPGGNDHYRQTAGVNAGGAAAGFHYGLEGYYQFGSLYRAGSDETVSAFLAAGRVGYTADVPVKPGATLFAEYLSGDGTPEGTFSTLYATNHKFYGELDYFLDIPTDTANLGLVDLGGRITVTPLPKLLLNADLHQFLSAEAVNGESTFGTEIDLKAVVSVYENLSLDAMFGVFIPGEAMRAVKGHADTVDLSPETLAYTTLDLKL